MSLSYQEHLKSQFSPAEYLLLTCILNLLQSLKIVNLEKIATALALPILFESRRRKLQRFLMLPQISFKTLWFPIFIDWVKSIYQPGDKLYLAFDRTSWAMINILVITLVYDHRAIPIYAQLLGKKGNSHLEEQKRVLKPALELLKDYCVIVLGDREFCSVKLAQWLDDEAVYFVLRLKKNEFIQKSDEIWVQLNEMDLKPGTHFFMQGVRVTKQKGFGPFNIAAKWQRKYRKQVSKEGWFLITNLKTLSAAIEAYKQRFDIEELFRDVKSGGYNLEQVGVNQDRLMSLLVLLTIVYTTATLDGQKIKKLNVQKYLGRVQEPGRSERRHSSFYIGLYGQLWVDFRGGCQEAIEAIMRLNSNKRKYYQKGQRAMELILTQL